MAMTEKQAEALKKAQAASVEKRKAKAEAKPPVPESTLESKIDRLTELMIGIKDSLEQIAKNQHTKLDTSFLK